MKFLMMNSIAALLCCTAQALTVTDDFNRANTAFATNNAQIAVSIGSNWKAARIDDPGTNTQYRILNNEVDIGAVSPTLLTKAMLINTAAATMNTGTGTNFTLSADFVQNTTNSTSYDGLVFNYQDGGTGDGSYYLFRANGNGSVQFLVYTNFVQQSGTVLNKPGAFTAVSNHAYTITVSSADPYVFNCSVFDKTAGTLVYSTNNLTVGGSFAKLQAGIGGMYATAGLATFDNFSLKTAIFYAFTGSNQVTWATNDVQIAAQIGTNWKRGNPADQDTQYRISNNQVDIGVVSATLITKALLINTGATTATAGAGTNFTLAATLQQDTTNSSASMGLVFNYQDAGNYYLFRASGTGAAQFLIYSNGVQLTGFSTPGAFTAVQNRPYTITVASADPYTFDLSIFDTVSSTIVYSTNITLAANVIKHQDGLGGLYATSGLAAFDDFSLIVSPDSGPTVQTIQLTVSAGTNGSVTPSSTNVPVGGSADFTITADAYYRIASLTTNGTAVMGMEFDNSSTSTNFTWSNVQAAGAVVATFTNQVAGDPANTPYEWLAQYGLTNYDTDAVADQDMDGLKAWQEYIAGTDPTNSASGFKVAQAARNTVTWTAQSNRIYSVYWSTNLVKGFTNLADNIVYPQGSYTNATPDEKVNHYQVKVRMQ